MNEYFDLSDLRQELSDSRFYSHSFARKQQFKVNALEEQYIFLKSRAIYEFRSGCNS